MNDSTVPVILKDMPPKIRGFCCLGSDYEPCIVINSRLDSKHQEQTYRHEMGHIERGEIYDEDYTEYEA